MPETKRCPWCTKDLPLACFSTDRSKPNGLVARCKPCVSETRPRDEAHKQRVRAYRAGRAEERRETDRAWYAANRKIVAINRKIRKLERET